MKVTSKSFADGERIPEEYAFAKIDPENRVTFAGNKNPHLAWSDVPEGTQSFAIVCVDSQAPTAADDVNQDDRVVPKDLQRTAFYHWGLIDVSPDAREVGEGECSAGVTPKGKRDPAGPPGTRQGETDFTNWFASDPDMAGRYLGYDGPAPPWNDSLRHVYHYVVFALSVPRVDLPEGFAAREIEASIAGQVLARAEICGWYTTNPDLL